MGRGSGSSSSWSTVRRPGRRRDHCLTSGQTDPTTWLTTDAGEQIGVGDLVATRRNDRDLGIANRDTWTITAVDADGSLQ